MRICNYNIEWMNGLFKDTKLDFSEDWSARYNVTKSRQIDAVAQVLRMVDADIFVILEAPNEYQPGATAAALENFAQHFGLRQNQALIGRHSGTDQEIACLYDPQKAKISYRPHQGPKPPKFSEEIEIDESELEGKFTFSKPPIELEIFDKTAKRKFHLIGAHFKTKAPHGAKTEKEAERFSLQNRKKQIAQAIWVRQRIDQILDPLVVCGDFNDGPGYDRFERKLGMSSIDILTEGGALFDPAIEARASITSARFFNREDHSFKEALLDFSFVNTKMRPHVKKWEIWHPFQNPRLMHIPDWQDALIDASDHFPVAMDIDWQDD